jgi:hypothetical protein
MPLLCEAEGMKVLATMQPGESVFAQMAPLLVALQAAGHASGGLHTGGCEATR